MRVKIGPCGSVTQATSKSTAVVCEGPAGQITMNNASLASNTSVGFTVTNSYVGAGDCVNVTMASGGTAASYVVMGELPAAGSFKVHVRNVTGGALGEALVLNYQIIKNNQ